MIAPRDRAADDEIFLAGVAVKQNLVRRKQAHEQRCALALTQVVQAFQKFLGKNSDVYAFPEVLDAGPWPVRGQV